MDLDTYREKSLATWDGIAPNWDDEREYMASVMAPVTDLAIERLDPGPGDSILELAGGPGEVGLAVAVRVGEGGSVLSTDFAPAMVEAAQQEAQRKGLGNMEFRVLDAERMDIEDSSFDGVVCRFGYMLMADPAAALRETRRVLKDGGRLSFVVWAPADQNLWAAIPGMTMVELGHQPPPEPGAPGIFALGEEDRIRELVTAAGFSEPQIEAVPVHWGYSDPEDHWRLTLKLAGPIKEAYESVSPEEQDKIRSTVMERVGERLKGGGDVDGMTLVVSAG
jgi:SAM-dependent methyltransferase